MTEQLPALFDISAEKVLEYLFERLPVGTAVIDRDFRLRRCNPTWAEFIDTYTPSSFGDVVPGVSLFDLEPDTEETLRELFEPVWTGETVRQEGVRLQSGGIVSYWDVVLVPLESKGEVVAALDVSLDATAHMLDQLALQSTLEALRESETNLRSMLENARGYAIYRLAVDPDRPYLGRVVLVSPSIREVVGIDDPYDFANWFSAVHPDDRERVVTANERAMREGVPFDEEMRFYDQRRDEWRWVHTVSNPILNEQGRVTHFNGIVIDVTDQRRAAETLENVNQMLESLVAERTQEIEQRHQELQALYQADEKLYQHLDLDAVLDSLVEVAVEVLRADKSSLMVWDEERRYLVVRAARGFSPSTLKQMRFLPNEGTVGRVGVKGEPAVVEDARLDERAVTRITEAEGIRSFMHVPITIGDQIFGVFNVDYTVPRSFREDEQRLFSALAQRAAIAIANAQLYEQEQDRRHESERRRRVAESMRDIIRVLNSSEPLPEVLEYIVAQFARLMDASICTLHHIDNENKFVHIEASYGLPAELQDIGGFPLLSSRADRLIMNRQPVIVSGRELPITELEQIPPAREKATDPRVRRWRETIMPRHPVFLAVPLVVQNEVYGSVAFYFDQVRELDDEEIELALSLGNQAALAIENARLRNQVEEAAATKERNRLARELHDAVTQTLFSASLIADVLPRIWDRNPDMALERLVELRELTRGALAEMRTLLLELRPTTLTESSLEELLRQLTAAVIGRSRLDVKLTVEGSRPLPPETQVALYRIAQEALNNAVKHAEASAVKIRLSFSDHEVMLSIQDNGRGFDVAEAGVQSMGLSIMRERVAKIGAELRIDSAPGAGTTVRVRTALPETEEE